MKCYSHPTNPGSRSTKRGARPWAGYLVVFGVRRHYGQMKNHELFWNPDTYDLARGLALEGHSSSPSSALVRKFGGRVLPFLDPPPPQLGRPSFSSLPPLGERPLFPPPRLHGWSLPYNRRMMSPTTLVARHSFEFPWPSSWPSSPAPHRVPGPAAPLSGRPLGLRGGEPDS